MIVIAAAVGGYILAHQNLHLPGWVPVLGKNWYTLKARFQTAQAVTPGQGQAVTIAGAKVGEVASVELQGGVATVTMRVTPKYARFYKNATMLMRPKTALEDMTIEVSPGTPGAGKLQSGETVPVVADGAEHRLRRIPGGPGHRNALLPAGAAGRGRRRPQPQRQGALGDAQALPSDHPPGHRNHPRTAAPPPEHRPARSTTSGCWWKRIGGKDEQLAELVDASNAVFATFAKEDADFRRTLHLLPGALEKTGNELGEGQDGLQRARIDADEAAAVRARRWRRPRSPRASSRWRPRRSSRTRSARSRAKSCRSSTNSRPRPKSSPRRSRNSPSASAVLNEFFNELAYNPGPKKGGFLFFLDWGNHDLNSVVSSADANGPLGRSLVYFNCEVLPILKGVAEVNPTVNLLVGLLQPADQGRMPGSRA